MKKGCKLLPKISGLKEYEKGGRTPNTNNRPGEKTTKKKRTKSDKPRDISIPSFIR